VSAYESLAKISSVFGAANKSLEDPWAKSPFRWLTLIPSRSKGAYGEKFVSELFRLNDFDVKRPLSGSDHDRVINGHRIEIKLSTLWAVNGNYKFQQIRDQKYDFLLCLGISPSSASCWVIPKDRISLELEGVTHQHGGKAGKDTMWLSFEAANPPKWMGEFGGTLESAMALLLSEGLGTHSGKALAKQDKIDLL
jgi:hypothetical protein